jgi:hypothetical protein
MYEIGNALSMAVFYYSLQLKCFVTVCFLNAGGSFSLEAEELGPLLLFNPLWCIHTLWP